MYYIRRYALLKRESFPCRAYEEICFARVRCRSPALITTCRFGTMSVPSPSSDILALFISSAHKFSKSRESYPILGPTVPQISSHRSTGLPSLLLASLSCRVRFKSCSTVLKGSLYIICCVRSSHRSSTSSRFMSAIFLPTGVALASFSN